MELASFKRKLTPPIRPLPVLLASTSNVAWGALLGLLIFLPFLGVLILGLQNYGMMETVRSAEKVDRSRVEVDLFHQQLDKQLLILEQSLKTKIEAADQQVGFNGLRMLNNNNRLIALAVKVNTNGRTPSGYENMSTYTELSLQKDSASEIKYSFRKLVEQNKVKVNRRGIWTPKNAIIGKAYLYCWQQNVISGFCTLITAKSLYDQLWGSEPLKKRRQQFLVNDHFNQKIASAALPSLHQFVINIRGLIFSVSLATEWTDEKPISNVWLFMAMIFPLLGLALAIAWMIYIHHQRQAKSAQKLLHGTQEIAHELRTPLSNISLFTELIMLSKPSKERDQYGKVLENEMQRITRIIDNAVALMRGDPVSGYETGQPLELLNTTASQYKRYLQEANCSLSINCNIGDISLHYPKQATEQILVNLISNIKKYAPNSHVTLGADYKNNTLYFWVRDEANHTLNKKVLVKPSGLGLGLMTCERLARNFSGEFKETVNKNGRCYNVSFPLQ